MVFNRDHVDADNARALFQGKHVAALLCCTTCETSLDDPCQGSVREETAADGAVVQELGDEHFYQNTLRQRLGFT
jgi:hypothetical protein